MPPRRTLLASLGPGALFFVLAWLQTRTLVHEAAGFAWFPFGTDTVSHDVPVHLWMREAIRNGGGTLPLWMPELKAGLPIVGAFLWTPFSPLVWSPVLLPFAFGYALQFTVALAWAQWGGYRLGRMQGLTRCEATLIGIAIGLGGHIVTLIHAGHLQKVLALAWLPWAALGVRALFCAGRWRGSTLWIGVSIGAAFLSGHPQIAYAMAGLAGLGGIAAAIARRTLTPAVLAAAMVASGLLLGGAQFVPGTEMSALSNRAAGVSFEEATETSYPPAEVVELFLPRHAGDSSQSGYGQYFGAWGERLVSDYAGVSVVVLALMGLGARASRREAALWASAAIVSLVVGFGRHTPLYQFLFRWLPGFASFRSPGTFMCIAWVALPAAAGAGLIALRSIQGRLSARTAITLAIVGAALACLGAAALAVTRSEEPARDVFLTLSIARSIILAGVGLALIGIAVWRGRSPAPLLAAVLALDLLLANRAFLRAVPWSDYAPYLAPDAIDVAVADDPAPRRVLEPGRELSLRPLANGRDALIGYHPISYGAFEEALTRTGLGTAEWRAQWGVRDVWLSAGEVPATLPPGWSLRARLNAAPGGALLRDTTAPAPIRRWDGGAFDFDWVERSPNRAVLEVRQDTAGTVEVAESLAPGWRWRVGDGEWQRATEVQLARAVSLPAGTTTVEWQYRPESHRLGLFLTMAGLAFLVALATAKRGVEGTPPSAFQSTDTSEG